MVHNHAARTENDVTGNLSALWEDLGESGGTEERYHSWLALQCSLIPQVISGVLLVRRAGSVENIYVPVSKWPERGGDAAGFAEILDQVIERRCGLLTELGSHYAIAYPVLIDDELHAVSALVVAAEDEASIQAAMMQLQWGVSWLEVMFRRDDGRKQKAELARLQSAVTLLAELLAEQQFQAAAMAFVNGLAAGLDCDRVSIGFACGRKMQISAFSHSARFSDRMNLIRAVEKAMDEAVMQRSEIIYPEMTGDMVIIRDHDQLSKQYGSGTILTLPLYGNKRYYGAVTLERPSHRSFEAVDVDFVRSVAALSGPVLEEKRLAGRPWPAKAGAFGKEQLKRLLGPRYPGRKLALTTAAALALFFSFARGDYRITADAVIEGELKRAVSAPFSGYINASTVRPGDIVTPETVLCSLDDRDLRLERLNFLSRRIQLKHQYQEALAGHNRSETNIIDARINQVDAQLGLVENKLARTLIKAPFDGILISGDLTQALGTLVQWGDLLFEIAPRDAYRLVLKVDESRIADVHEGQTGVLVLPAFPGKPLDFTVERITPVSIAESGQNRFQVEARLKESTERLRPGMEGVGKIFVDRRNLFAVWTRPLVEKIRLWAWSWRP